MNNNNNNNQDRRDPWITGAVVATAGVLTGAALYFFTRPNTEAQNTQSRNTRRREIVNPQPTASTENRTAASVASYLSSIFNRIETSRGGTSSSLTVHETAPDNPVITNLNSLLSDIHVRFIKLKDFTLHYRVFDKIFLDLHRKMKEVDPYYGKYSSTVQFAGSHFDNLRIKKPDEFDMDIVISLPLNIKTDPFDPCKSDITFEPKSAGFIQLKTGIQFQRLPMRDKEEWQINRVAYEWKDESHYLLRDKFTNWFKSVVTKALNQFDVNLDGRSLYYVDGIKYIIDKSESGPAVTLKIKSPTTGFKMDVDLVPCLKFPEDRWPIARSYRSIPPMCKKGYWMVVPKPNKAAANDYDRIRSWRLALHNQERELLRDSKNLRQAIRLLKLLRDAQHMDKIASYYIKTIFFLEIIDKQDKDFWAKNNPATLFKLMVGKLYQALMEGRIPYFWEKNNNLIDAVDKATLNRYALKLVPLIRILNDPSQYKLVAKYLLTPKEFDDYNRRFLHI